MYKRISANNPIMIHFQAYSSIYFFIITLFMMGVIFGAIVVNSLSFTQKEELYFYLTQFFGQVEDGKVAASEDLFRQSFFHNFKYIGLLWVLGISIIGLPLIFVFLFMKGMVIGFSIGFLVNQMEWQGFMLSFVSVFPQNLLIIPVFIFIAAMSVGVSLQLIRKLFTRQAANIHIIPMFSKYIVAFVLAIAVISVAASIEAYLSPSLMKSVISSIKL
ncbi:stage II sporulation protein M [Bacillus sp. 2205SS5-2]|uniref:stage II sporulation protein M n=1 Tax=Bacillus sp. 2205SS5-2 TaxID=3109031 RepID=UPI003007514A